MKTVALFNDTGSQDHVGCRAVSRAHRGMLQDVGIRVGYSSGHDQWHELWQGSEAATCAAVRKAAVMESIRAADAVIVNGEGTLHHGFGPNLLGILQVAQEEGKPTFLVNALVQSCTHFLDTLARLTDCVGRDQASSAYLSGLGIRHRLVPDSILACPWSPEPSVDLSGKIVVTDWHPSRDADVGARLRRLCRRLGDQAAYYPLEHPDRASDWEHTVANWAAARVVITGRHHGVYLATLARVPFLAFPSNSHKIEGLLAMSPAPLAMGRDGLRMRIQIRRLLRDPAPCLALADHLQAQCPLQTFRELDACLQGGPFV